MYVCWTILLGEEATDQDIFEYFNAKFNFMEKNIDDIYKMVELNYNVTVNLIEYLNQHPECQLDYYVMPWMQ